MLSLYVRIRNSFSCIWYLLYKRRQRQRIISFIICRDSTWHLGQNSGETCMHGSLKINDTTRRRYVLNLKYHSTKMASLCPIVYMIKVFNLRSDIQFFTHDKTMSFLNLIHILLMLRVELRTLTQVWFNSYTT